MHLQQPQHNQYGQVVGEDIGTAYPVLKDIPEGMVRRATAEATRMATDHNATGVVPEHTQGQHRVHAEQLRRGQRFTHIQGLRDSKDAEESRLLARKRGRKYAK